MRDFNKKNIFTASCMSLVVTSMTFAIRAGILKDLGSEFSLSNQQLGFINSMAFFGFPVATVIGGLLYNIIGAKKLMAIAFFGHLLGLIMTISATGFWTLFISTFLIGFANGSVEAGCNPMIADMYTKNRTTMLNRFHVWFPGGIVIGSLLSKFMSDFGLGWQLQITLIIIPTLIYGYLFLREYLPKSQHVETSLMINLKSLITPLFVLITICMSLTSISEFGPQQWIEQILGSSGVSPMLILAMVTGIMAVGRFFAGPIIHKINPTGVLLMSAIITTIAIYSMSVSEGYFIYLAAILFAVGVCYFWPTMIGFVSEYLPKTGALGMSLIGGVGMLSTSIWQPIIGFWIDSEREKAVLNGVLETNIETIAGQAALSNMVFFPLSLIVLFSILFIFRKGIEKHRVPQKTN